MIPRRVRWLAVLLPALVVGMIELLSDTVLDPYLPFPLDTLAVTLVVALLAAAFARWTFGRMDRLTTSLEARNREVEARAASANALHSVSQSIASLADIQEIMDATVHSARALLSAESGLLTLIGPDGEPVLRATSGPESNFDRTGSGEGDEARRFLRGRPDTALLAAPLRRGGTTIGTLAVAGFSTPRHEVGDVETLSSLANQAAIAIENHRLEAELRRLAVQHERERIAREIHDGLAQVLGYVNTKSQAVEGLLGSGRLDEAQAQMAELSAAARSIYVDVREAIQGLTETAGGDVELGAEIRDYADRFAEASKLAVSVHLEPGFEAIPLRAEVRDDVFGIVREALTNVRKHAAAHRVNVSLGVQDGRLIATIVDDGRGFDPDHVADGPADWPNYGMTTMRRRATAIDAHLDWTSAPGVGTTVTLMVPLDDGPRRTGTDVAAGAAVEAAE
jgi:signal transduction histidine kinase